MSLTVWLDVTRFRRHPNQLVHLDPEMTQFAILKLATARMSRTQHSQPDSQIVAQRLERVGFRPDGIRLRCKALNPTIHLPGPVGAGLLLHVGLLATDGLGLLGTGK